MKKHLAKQQTFQAPVPQVPSNDPFPLRRGFLPKKAGQEYSGRDTIINKSKRHIGDSCSTVARSGFVQRTAMPLLRRWADGGCWHYPQRHSGLSFGSLVRLLPFLTGAQTSGNPLFNSAETSAHGSSPWVFETPRCGAGVSKKRGCPFSQDFLAFRSPEKGKSRT